MQCLINASDFGYSVILWPYQKLASIKEQKIKNKGQKADKINPPF
jgi:hypothetical protein